VLYTVTYQQKEAGNVSQCEAVSMPESVRVRIGADDGAWPGVPRRAPELGMNSFNATFSASGR
jgi:hypothetical protein